MKITFCLPRCLREPAGGFKVVYLYSNLLAREGHEVTIVYDNQNFPRFPYIRNNKFLLKAGIDIFYGIRPRWYELVDTIRCVYAYEGLSDKYVPDGDIVIATAVETADLVEKLSISKGKKVYFVQGHENWNYGEEYAIQTYKLNMTIVTISDWLKSIIEKYSNNEIYIVKNGVELEDFYITNPIEKRNPNVIAMLYHKMEHKGSKYGIEALKKVYQDNNNTTVLMFGTCDPPVDLPPWIKYIKNANKEQLRKIYNEAAIFLCPSIQEGFGLTGAESMACGCALVTTNYEGIKEYANENNAVFCKVKDSESLYSGILRVMLNDSFRISLAKKGNEDIQSFSWKQSVNDLIDIFGEIV